MVLAAPLLLDGVPATLDWLRRSGVRRLVIDSRQVRPGDAFIAWPGAAHDARRFVSDALQAGAVVCLVDAAGVEAFGFEDERVAALAHLKRRLGDIASAFEGHPSRSIDVVAFTGTNGKTSSAWWLAQASGLLGQDCGLMGTLGVGEPPVGSRSGQWDATGLTTPDPVTLHRALAAMHARGLHRCAIEASSIGLAEHRLEGLQIAVAVFTNFTLDHLDYHGTLENYWAAKRVLFDWPSLRAAVVDIDDPRGAALAQELEGQGWSQHRMSGATEAARHGQEAACVRELWTTGQSMQARLQARSVRQTPQGMAFELVEAGREPMTVQTAFFGAYNVSNLLGVIGALRAQGHSLEDSVQVLSGLTAVPGRMERRGEEGGPLAVVDYAHTPDALDKALSALRPLAQARGGRLWCVFGCGGNRDRSKRPQMGALAQRRADRVVLTSDNPRHEPPMQILQDILEGMGANEQVHQEADRAAAVQWALLHAGDQDVVLVAGKGHEDYQEIQGVRVPCRDVDLVDAALQARQQALRPVMMTVAQAAQMLPASHLHGAGEVPIRRVHTDTRSLREGDLYVALKGERFDGHAFLAQARDAGAAAAVAEQGLEGLGLAGLQVADSLGALQQLATAWRSQLSLPVIGVTGSNGKTTVTQMTASILRAWLGPQAGGTRGNLNNHIGVPLTLLSLRASGALAHRAAVVELGMNHPGEIALLAAIAQPTVAVVNNAQREHQEFMHTVEAVARENGSVLQALPAQGTAVFPASDAYASLWAAMAKQGHPRRVWRFAFEIVEDTPGPVDVEAEVHAFVRDQGDHWSIHLKTPVGTARTTLHLAGVHNVHNAVAAASAALAAGAPLWAVEQGIAAFEPVQGRSMRLRAHHAGREFTLIDDSYNANPDSVRAAIDLLAGLEGPQTLVLGDMGEVGDQGPAFHAEAGAHAAARGIGHLWCAGELSRHAAQAFGPAARHFETVEGLIAELSQWPAVASALVKGSRFMRMERVVQALRLGSKGAH